MSRPRESLIASLAEDATPVRDPGRTGRKTALTLLLAAVIALGAMLIEGPFRGGLMSALTTYPRFALEIVIGAALLVSLWRVAIGSGIPQPAPMIQRAGVPLLLGMLWTSLFLYNLLDPALPTTMDAKRTHCWLDVLVLSVPGYYLGWRVLRGLWPLHGAWSGALLGLACGITPGLAMQVACMYEPRHNFLFHLLPVLACGVVGAIIGRRWLKPRA